MIRFTHLFFLLVLFIAAPLFGQSKAPPAPQSNQAAQIVAQDAKIEALTKSVGEARYEKNIAEIKAEILQSQTSWFEILTSSMIGLFGILITVIIIYFAFRFGKAAVSEAKAAAVDELKTERASIQNLLDQAKAAVADIHVERETARELTKGLRADEAPSDPETQEKIADLAKSAMQKLRKERSLDDYRALVLQARIQKDWATMERRASAMAYLFEGEADDESLTFALFSKAYALGKLRKPIEAIATYDEMMSRFSNNDIPALQELVAMALVNKSIDLAALNLHEAAIATYDNIVSRFGDEGSPAMQEAVANALVNKGLDLAALTRHEAAIAAYEEVIARFGGKDSTALQKLVAKALVNKGVALCALNHHEAAIVAFDEVVVRYSDKDGSVLQDAVAKALYNKACALAVMSKIE